MATETIQDYPHVGQMIEGYDYAAPITFDAKYGHLEGGHFPAECIADCSASGAVDEAVAYWLKRLNFIAALTPHRALVVRGLREYGAWDDFAIADMETLAARVLWLACCDMREQGEWFGIGQ